jgi:hypothetical protein
MKLHNANAACERKKCKRRWVSQSQTQLQPSSQRKLERPVIGWFKGQEAEKQDGLSCYHRSKEGGYLMPLDVIPPGHTEGALWNEAAGWEIPCTETEEVAQRFRMNWHAGIDLFSDSLRVGVY